MDENHRPAFNARIPEPLFMAHKFYLNKFWIQIQTQTRSGVVFNVEKYI